MDVIKRIIQLQEDRGWSIYQLAKEAELSQNTVRNMFKRGTAPSIATLEALCRAFKINLSQFFADDGDLIQLTKDQRAMLETWNTLSDEQKTALLELINKFK
ncbi:helix-turn-helix transcriptional regulator [Christensenellaceae bacterium OttesenSCG-928-M15]|nr:helix-turn-helix transcriptional regulator [Christensenellaceae bacterium OttesenSCG-928-M15]